MNRGFLMKRWHWIVAAIPIGWMALVISSWSRAADLGVNKAPPYAASASTYNWSGIWLGIRGGYGANTTSVGTLSDGVSALDIGSAPKGFVGGVDGGIDFQFSPAFVGGIYIEQDFADLRSSVNADLRSSVNMGGVTSLSNLTSYLGSAGA